MTLCAPATADKAAADQTKLAPGSTLRAARVPAGPPRPAGSRRATLPPRATLRPATVADIDRLMQIETEVFDYERLTRRSFARYIRQASAIVLVIETGGEVVGYGLVSFRAASAACRLESIAVATRASGRGHGGAVLVALQSLARGRGARCLRLEVRRDNQAAITLYERLGFRFEGIRQAYYCDGCDALRMYIDL